MSSIIERQGLLSKVQKALTRAPIVSLLGPRQCGKTTLAKIIAEDTSCTYFDLEHPQVVSRLANPLLVLEPLEGLVILDEVQRMPELFPILRVLADRKPLLVRFLILGSASPDLIRQSSETLAGRVEFVYMSGFGIDEIGESSYDKLWIRGGFPPSYLADSLEDSYAWRENFIQTFLERDLGQLGVQIPSQAMQRFWFMLTHYHGQIWNSSDIARSLGVSYATTKRHLDILTAAYMVRQLQPWFENIGKRQVKSPRIFIRDTGIFHTLIGLENMGALQTHPKFGASWEGFVIEQIISLQGERHCFFWRTQAGAELDLLVMKSGKRIGFEVKCTDAPGMTKSIYSALEDLHPDHIYVIYPGKERYAIHEKVTVTTIKELYEIFDVPFADSKQEVSL